MKKTVSPDSRAATARAASRSWLCRWGGGVPTSPGNGGGRTPSGIWGAAWAWPRTLAAGRWRMGASNAEGILSFP